VEAKARNHIKTFDAKSSYSCPCPTCIGHAEIFQAGARATGEPLALALKEAMDVLDFYAHFTPASVAKGRIRAILEEAAK